MIELLVTVTIMGVAFIVVVGGLSVAILGSDLNHRQATVDSVLRNSAELVKTMPYVPDCSAARTTYGTALPGASDYTVEVTAVDPIAGSADQFVTCPSADLGLQLVSVRVTSTKRPISESLQVVKRK